MAAKTQFRAISPFTGPRYRSFAGKRTAAPDFMHGVLTIQLSIDGSIRTCPYVAGESSVKLHVCGKIQVNP